MNIFISRQLTEYKYQIYRFLQPDRMRILNIFVPVYLNEYEYRIYLFLETSPNMKIEYIQCKLLMTPFHRKVHFKQALVHICAGTRGVSTAWWTGYINLCI